ncbi:hypothetical protein FRB99_006245 [Tulasnella sp. 403]|nr:hypothetical protein FRB99_006245 [Tulasnella sp. 403]
MAGDVPRYWLTLHNLQQSRRVVFKVYEDPYGPEYSQMWSCRIHLTYVDTAHFNPMFIGHVAIGHGTSRQGAKEEAAMHLLRQLGVPNDMIV